PEVAVLLELERVPFLALHPPADGVERSHPRITGPGEHELAGHPGSNHLVVDDVRGQPAERQLPLLLPDDLVPGGEADEVGEPLDGDRIAVADQVRDGLAHRGDLRTRGPPGHGQAVSGASGPASKGPTA